MFYLNNMFFFTNFVVGNLAFSLQPKVVSKNVPFPNRSLVLCSENIFLALICFLENVCSVTIRCQKYIVS